MKGEPTYGELVKDWKKLSVRVDNLEMALEVIDMLVSSKYRDNTEADETIRQITVFLNELKVG